MSRTFCHYFYRVCYLIIDQPLWYKIIGKIWWKIRYIFLAHVVMPLQPCKILNSDSTCLWRNKKRQIVLGVNWTKWHSLRSKLNEELVEGVIQTLAILEGSNLDFFLDSFSRMEWVSKILLKSKLQMITPRVHNKDTIKN